MNILAIDPGPEKSAFVLWNTDCEEIIDKGICENINFKLAPVDIDLLAVEMIESYGMPVGKDVFETCLWIGEFRCYAKAFEIPFELVYRSKVKMHFCNARGAKDSNVRQAEIDRYGKPGTKKNPGKLYGVKYDIWQALGIAIYIMDKQNNGK